VTGGELAEERVVKRGQNVDNEDGSIVRAELGLAQPILQHHHGARAPARAVGEDERLRVPRDVPCTGEDSLREPFSAELGWDVEEHQEGEKGGSRANWD
jgi:hypothetical protein